MCENCNELGICPECRGTRHVDLHTGCNDQGNDNRGGTWCCHAVRGKRWLASSCRGASYGLDLLGMQSGDALRGTRSFSTGKPSQTLSRRHRDRRSRDLKESMVIRPVPHKGRIAPVAGRDTANHHGTRAFSPRCDFVHG